MTPEEYDNLKQSLARIDANITNNENAQKTKKISETIIKIVKQTALQKEFNVLTDLQLKIKVLLNTFYIIFLIIKVRIYYIIIIKNIVICNDQNLKNIMHSYGMKKRFMIQIDNWLVYTDFCFYKKNKNKK